MTNLSISNFEIEQTPCEGHPISIYQIDTGLPCRTSTVYINNGKIHAGSFGDTSREYYIHASNVVVDNTHFSFKDFENGFDSAYAVNNYINYLKFLNDGAYSTMSYETWCDNDNWVDYYLDTTLRTQAEELINALDSNRLAFTFWEESYGEFHNCSFPNMVRNGKYYNCTFTPENPSNFLDLEYPRKTDESIEEILFDNCTINLVTTSSALNLINAKSVMPPSSTTPLVSKQINFIGGFINFSGPEKPRLLYAKDIGAPISIWYDGVSFARLDSNGKLVGVYSPSSRQITCPVSIFYYCCTYDNFVSKSTNTYRNPDTSELLIVENNFDNTSES